ncbi:MAG: bacteriocin [Quinella sp. 2Q5]|nr:bacteriocin [Quinella sp. 2Q5]
MAEEKIVSEQLTEDQLENVVGGVHEQTYDDKYYL